MEIGLDRFSTEFFLTFIFNLVLSKFSLINHFQLCPITIKNDVCLLPEQSCKVCLQKINFQPALFLNYNLYSESSETRRRWQFDFPGCFPLSAMASVAPEDGKTRGKDHQARHGNKIQFQEVSSLTSILCLGGIDVKEYVKWTQTDMSWHLTLQSFFRSTPPHNLFNCVRVSLETFDWFVDLFILWF